MLSQQSLQMSANARSSTIRDFIVIECQNEMSNDEGQPAILVTQHAYDVIQQISFYSRLKIEINKNCARNKSWLAEKT